MGGLICDNTVQVRRIALWGYQPGHFDGMDIKILKFDETDMQTLINANDGSYDAYLDDITNYSEIFYKAKLKPAGYAIPYVTNHRYKIHWANGLDFT